MKTELLKKIQAISNHPDITSLVKDMTVGNKGSKNSYNVVSSPAILRAVKKAEKEFGVVSMAINTELLDTSVQVNKTSYGESRTFVDLIRVTYRIYEVDDVESYIDVQSLARGYDSMDKGTGKAATYAIKYALINAYKIAVGDDADEIPSEQAKPQNKVVNKRNDVYAYFNEHTNYIQKTLSNFAKGSFEELTNEEINTIYNGLKAKGRI